VVGLLFCRKVFSTKKKLKQVLTHTPAQRAATAPRNNPRVLTNSGVVTTQAGDEKHAHPLMLEPLLKPVTILSKIEQFAQSQEHSPRL
jgi:hypothetical protein